jgi:hypothetical protein
VTLARARHFFLGKGSKAVNCPEQLSSSLHGIGEVNLADTTLPHRTINKIGKHLHGQAGRQRIAGNPTYFKRASSSIATLGRCLHSAILVSKNYLGASKAYAKQYPGMRQEEILPSRRLQVSNKILLCSRHSAM